MNDPGHPTTGIRDTDPLIQRPAPQGARYRLVRELGRGGGSVVYLALDTAVGQQVAFKRMSAAPDAQRMERMRREVQAGRALSHPGLVRVFELVEPPEGPAIVMELVEGQTLRQILRERGALPQEEALRICRRLLEALEALHGAGLLHRDVKPENVFLTPDGGVKLGDYSICLPMERTRLTAEGGALGTLGYMAPEQMEGRETGPASDLYGVAVVAYEMLTGRRPWQEETPSQTIYAQLHRAPDIGALASAGIPRWLRGHLRRCLSKRPAERFPSARAALDALDHRRGRSAPTALVRRAAAFLALAAVAGAGVWAATRALRPGHGSLTVADATIRGFDGIGALQWERRLQAPLAAYVVACLDGDGAPELFGMESGPVPTGTHFPLVYIDHQGESAAPANSFPADGSQGLSGGYHARLLAEDLNGDGAAEVWGTISSMWYPTYGFLFNSRDHRLGLWLFHPGQIAETAFADLDGDGIKDILCRAMNNVFGHEGVLFALDGGSVSDSRNYYPALCLLPGWNFPKSIEFPQPLLFYDFLPHRDYVFNGRSGTLRVGEDGWTVAPEGMPFAFDRWGGLAGREAMGGGIPRRTAVLDYFGRLHRMEEAGRNRDRALAPDPDWTLPEPFRGLQPWQRVFLMVRGRALLRLGETEAGLRDLRELAEALPDDYEAHEMLGVQLFLSTGNLEAARELVLREAAHCRFRPSAARVIVFKMALIAGEGDPSEVTRLEGDFATNSGPMERVRLLMGLGDWAGARAALDMIGTAPAALYGTGRRCGTAVLDAVEGRLAPPVLEAARREAEEFVELSPLVTLARAIDALRHGGMNGRREAASLLAPLREAARTDLDARLYLTIFDRATRQAR